MASIVAAELVAALGRGETRPEPPVTRPAGVVVAVHAPSPAERARATSVFRRHGADSIEVAEGTWKDGAWRDFDPVSIPRWRKPPERP